MSLRNGSCGAGPCGGASGGELRAQSSEALFDGVYTELRQGLEYESGVPTGRLERTRDNRDGLLHRYLLFIPESYDPRRRYPVSVYLHGGVARPDPGPGGSWERDTERVTGEDHITVFPLATRESLWWEASQVENLNGILTELKRTYNVDENRVFAVGVSDGGTGVYFLGFRDTTPWAGFLSFIGYPGVLLNPRVGADGLMHLANLVNKPLFIVNGENRPALSRPLHGAVPGRLPEVWGRFRVQTEARRPRHELVARGAGTHGGVHEDPSS